jgi:hypothetical protein
MHERGSLISFVLRSTISSADFHHRRLQSRGSHVVCRMRKSAVIHVTASHSRRSWQCHVGCCGNDRLRPRSQSCMPSVHCASGEDARCHTVRALTGASRARFIRQTVGSLGQRFHTHGFQRTDRKSCRSSRGFRKKAFPFCPPRRSRPPWPASPPARPSHYPHPTLDLTSFTKIRRYGKVFFQIEQ